MSLKALVHQKRPLFSVEFFPPKNEGMEKRFHRTAEVVAKHQPDFVSMTYGAGGSTRDRSLASARYLKRFPELRIVPHLTCTGQSPKEVEGLLESFASEGFSGIMALRGDRPNQDDSLPESSFRHASDLVSLIRSTHPELAIGVAGYPEVHPEAASPEEDLDWLKHKVDLGADFITTQLFFENRVFLEFLKRCREKGIQCPIFAGVMPAVSGPQVKRFCQMCGASIPPRLLDQLKAVEGNPEEERSIGVRWALDQVRELLDHGLDGIHLYLLNQPESAEMLLEGLSVAKR